MLRRLTLVSVLLLLVASIAGAQSVPTVVNYQGRLLENTPGQAPIDSTVAIDFTLFGSPTLNDNLWSESWPSVMVVDGIFNVLLGNNGSPIPSSLFTPGTDLYLEITIDGEILTPRQRFGSVAWAFHAENASNLSQQCDDGQVLMFDSGNWACTDFPCTPGFGDCDMVGVNGCETALTTLSDCGSCNQPCALDNAGESCASGMCLITGCDPNWASCDGVDATGCETSTETVSDCGACGVPCTFANASASCPSGSCTFNSCNSGFSTCDGNLGNGCEIDHSAVTGSCASTTFVGAYDGDTACGFICGDNSAWSTFSSQTGNNSRWFRATLREDSDCSALIEHRIRLAVPAGIDYDLYAYIDPSCNTPFASSTNGGFGVDEQIIIQSTDSASDDTFNYYIEVRYFSGATCSNYTLFFDGHNC